MEERQNGTEWKRNEEYGTEEEQTKKRRNGETNGRKTNEENGMEEKQNRTQEKQN